MQDLLTTSDPDWAAFNNGDPDYLLRVTGEVIRKYCGWHIFPNMQFTVANLEIGTRGAIALPSMYVTNVVSVTLQDPSNEGNDVVLNPSDYSWFRYGMIEPTAWQWWGAYSGYYYGPENWSFLPITQFGLVTVTFDSGYETVPDPVKQVAYELASWAGLFKIGGDAKEVASPGFRLALGGGANGDGGTGMSLNQSQKNRLAPYRIQGVA